MSNEKIINKINLHVGCGENYYPEYLNIDINEKSIADIIAHAICLPIKGESVTSIKAYHVIEHFDWVDIQFLLNEWYRVLIRGGEVTIEVPDIEKGIKELKRKKTLKEQVKSIQWMFGIDTPGMQHKSGVTFEVIRNTLYELGYENITKKKPKTHLYGQGLRISCNKPEGENLEEKSLRNSYRTRVYKYLSANPSTEKTLLELNHLNKIYDMLGSVEKIKEEKQQIDTILDLTIANPTLARELLEVLTEEDIITTDTSKKWKYLLKYLEKISIQKKIITLWKKRLKTPGKFNEEFHQFIQEIKTKLISGLRNSKSIEKNFSYLSKLEDENLLFFDKYFILQNAIVNFNLGLRYFNREEYTKALNTLQESLRYCKDNFLVYWNIARLLALKDDTQVEQYYKTAYDLIQNKNRKITLKKEIIEVVVEKNDLEYRTPYSVTD
ncbi:MAG: methyltransferase domain-containing protein [Candidatus Hodarchaeales archaeon]|jgi:predicted SAM-dependent methyltransferase